MGGEKDEANEQSGLRCNGIHPDDGNDSRS
jgi:hypothetical protein